MSGIGCARNPMNNFELNKANFRDLSGNSKIGAVDFVKDKSGSFETCSIPSGKANSLIEKGLKEDPDGKHVIIMNSLSIDPLTKKIPDGHVYLPFVD